MRLLWMILCLWALCAQAQEAVFTGKQGDELYDLLTEEFRPGNLMDYGSARDSMYLKVYRDDDGYVECYYTGHKTFLPLGVDPSSFLYMGGVHLGVTAEHIYPQSKGASELPARSDLHSLVPAIWRTNEARSNYPFGEVPDSETDHWYLHDEDRVDIPETDIDAYSERLNGGFGTPGVFEPRESVKGDIARAVFYFYTIYREEALQADPDFFEEMKETLYLWHVNDPVDNNESVRNERKAQYQNGKLNPYILDCSLVRRMYFQNEDPMEEECSDEVNTSADYFQKNNFIVAPNPVMDILSVSTSSIDNKYSISVCDMFGLSYHESQVSGTTSIDVGQLPSGLYLVILKDASGRAQSQRIVKL